MSTPVPVDPESEPSTTAPAHAEQGHPTPATHNDHLDPITGEPHAHPVGVGVGAMGAGAIGAAIGAFLGPIGVVAGAAIGAIAGGLAGKEVAEESEISPTDTDAGEPLDEFDHAPGPVSSEEVPLSSALSERTEPADDAFFTGGTVSGHDPELTETPLDDFDRSHSATISATPVPVEASGGVTAIPMALTAASGSSTDPFADDHPLPTASTGLITPDESSFFADDTTGDSAILAASPLPAAFAVNAEGSSESVGDSAAYAGHFDAEHTVRTAAYYRYLDRETTHQPGSELEDWIKAEQEVLGH